jgi:glutamate-1-semialdehyde 2,1-aminomutase
VGSLFKIHPSSHTLVDYRSSRPDAEEAARLDRIVRYLLDHGVLLSTTGLGCLSTPMAEPEVESFLEVFTAALAAERRAAP